MVKPRSAPPARTYEPDDDQPLNVPRWDTPAWTPPTLAVPAGNGPKDEEDDEEE